MPSCYDQLADGKSDFLPDTPLFNVPHFVRASTISSEDTITMQCACCDTDEPSPDPTQFGRLLVSEHVTIEKRPGLIFPDAITRYTYSGNIIAWFVCDECAKKGGDWSRLGIDILAILLCVALLVFAATNATARVFWIAAMMAIPAILVSAFGLYYSIVKDKVRTSEYRHDRMLERAIGELVEREDFIGAYGRIRIDGTRDTAVFTRFTREPIHDYTNINNVIMQAQLSFIPILGWFQALALIVNPGKGRIKLLGLGLLLLHSTFLFLVFSS